MSNGKKEKKSYWNKHVKTISKYFFLKDIFPLSSVQSPDILYISATIKKKFN